MNRQPSAKPPRWWSPKVSPRRVRLWRPLRLRRQRSERAAETLDKFEEDLLGSPTATIRGARSVTVAFGEPISIPAEKGKKDAAAALTRTIETPVQHLLDGLETS